MTVTSVCIVSDQRQGTVGVDGVNEYRVPFFVETDDPQDGPKTVTDAILADQTWVLGQTGYAVGNDSDTTSTLQKIVPTPLSKTRWSAVANFGKPSANSEKDEDGNDTDDPLQWRGEYQQVLTSVVVPVDTFDVWNRTDLAHDPINRPLDPGTGDGPKGVVTNSAGTRPLFSPTVTRNFVGWAIRLYLNNYNDQSISVYQDAVNDRDIVLSLPAYAPAYTQRLYVKHSLQCTKAVASLQNINDVDVWVHDYEFAHDPLTFHYLRTTDEAITRVACPGEPDGNGGTISAGDDVAGRSNTINIKGKTGDPVVQSAYLDGSGKPLEECANLQPKILEWRWLEERDFTSIVFPPPWLTP